MESTYFVVQDGQQTGPYPLSSLRTLIDQGLITLQHLCWKEGMANWAPIHEVLPMAFTSPASPALPPLAATNPYAPPKAALPRSAEATPDIKYGGIGRLAYIGGSLLNSLVVAVLSTVSQDPDNILPLIFAIVVGFTLMSLRMRNIGISLWYWFLLLIPLINGFFLMAIGIYALLAPEGYAHHRKLDKPAKIILWILLGLIAIPVLMFIFSAIGLFR